MSPQAKPVITDHEALSIFTDGSSLPGPRRGGIGFLLIWTGEDGNELREEIPRPGYKGATNNQMELKACIEALQFVKTRRSPVDPDNFDKIDVYTDSMYVVDGIKAALFEWSRSAWIKKDGNPVRNADEWQELVRLVKKLRPIVRIKWCKGHSPRLNPNNKRADQLAKASARGHLPAPLHVTRVGRKWTAKPTEIGSIKAEGQDIAIRVITDEWLRKPKMYAYKIEVIDENSPYFGNVDEYFSDDVMLNARHCYLVRLNDDLDRRRIVENLGEIEDAARPSIEGPSLN